MKLEKSVAYDCPHPTQTEYFEKSNYVVRVEGKGLDKPFLRAGWKGLIGSPGQFCEAGVPSAGEPEGLQPLCSHAPWGHVRSPAIPLTEDAHLLAV